MEKKCHFHVLAAKVSENIKGAGYFLVPHKCGIFGVCCEGVPQQINYLTDETHCISKVSNAVIAYLHHFFSEYRLREKRIQLHCDNCSGQNKSSYCGTWHGDAWWVFMSVSLNYLIADHTKFPPDWYFVLFKKSVPLYTSF